jgi:hypothetical protein
VRPSPEQLTALRTIGNAAIGVGLGISVLAIAVIVSEYATGLGSVAPAGSSPSSAVVPDTRALATTPPPTTSPTAPAATVTPTPTPSATSDPLTVTAYARGGRRYAALHAPIDYVYRAPIAGTVQIRMYQLIDGDVRVGSNVQSLPFFPYVTLESTDRRIVYRTGALDADTKLLVKDGERAEAGTPLFMIVGEGASSWRTFYDRGVTANVIASVNALPSGAELDPVAFFAKP